MAIKAALIALLCGAALPVWAEEPLSAIDWLSKSVTTPAGAKLPKPTPAVTPPPKPKTTPITSNASPPQVEVTVLGAGAPDGVGLLSPAVTGLPRNLWGLGKTEEIAAKLTRERADALPALRSLLILLLLAEADPPVDAGGRGVLLMARIDKLLAMGAIDQAQALISVATPPSAELFRRRFDIALLSGKEDSACAEMAASPNLAPTFPARIFCLARAGDWNAAALTLKTAQALGQITPQEDQLLTRFLDSEMDDGGETLPPPDHPTPLVWRIYEAIGEPLPTDGLPIAFANAELRDQAGWKSQLDAAERLARAGAIAPSQLWEIYAARAPAASGGVWDRVEAVQEFDAALTTGEAAKTRAALEKVWPLMVEAELEVAFSNLFSRRVMAVADPEDDIAFHMALLSSRYEEAARAHKPHDAADAFVQGLAIGDLTGVPPQDAVGRAIVAAFSGLPPSPEAAQLLAANRLGEALLLAIDQISDGVQGDLRNVTEGLTLLRQVGLEDVARRTALELMLLERRG